MELTLLFRQLGIALGLGLLVGLQREHSASAIAGIRTFPLVTIFGALSALLAQSFGGWVVAAGFVSVSAVIVIGNVAKFRAGPADPGLTTEAAMLLMYGVGAYTVVGHEAIAIAIGAVAAALLQYKGQLHGIAKKLGDEDLRAIMQFALISFVILPVLPDKTYGPYSVLNPRQIWWMVVLIVGLSLAGYIAYKFLGENAGVLLGGALGGAISSTATTVSYSRRAASAPETSRLAAIVIMTASTVVFARVLLEIAVVAPGFLSEAAPPIIAMLILFIFFCALAWLRGREEQTSMPEQQNPSELKTALVFALIYAIVLVAIAGAKDQFGSRGLYIVAALSGLTDVDAITLSTAQLVNTGTVESDQGWRIILLALISNVLFKGATVAMIGHRLLFSKIVWYYAISIAAGLLLILLWP